MSEGAMGRIVVAAPLATAEKLEGILAAADLKPDAVYAAGADALAAVRREGAVMLTTWRLADMTGAELAKRLGDAYDVLMIVPPDYEETPDNPALTLHNPVSPDALLQSVRAMRHCHGRLNELRDKTQKLERTLEERKVIDRAKGRLMDALHLTEAEAHHRIQKRSMDTGRRLAEVAQEILDAEDVSAW